jgi:uncharacterized protein YndB with AHSA1/START domain
MRGPDGTIYPMTGVFQEIVEPERLVFLSVVPDEAGKSLFEVLNTLTFVETDAKTTMNLTARIIKAAPGAGKYLGGMNEGWSQSLERLGEFLAKA